MILSAHTAMNYQEWELVCRYVLHDANTVVRNGDTLIADTPLKDVNIEARDMYLEESLARYAAAI